MHYSSHLDLRRTAVLIAVTVLVAGLALVGLPTPGAWAASTVNPAADAYVDGGNTTRNYGTRGYLYADASPERVSYLRFEVTGADATSGLLRLYAASDNSGIKVLRVADNTWSETQITYANRPQLGATIAETGQITRGTWVEVDVSSYVTRPGTYSFAVTTLGSSALSMHSREASRPPELVAPAPQKATGYTIAGSGSSYTATSNTVPPVVYSGSVKSVVEAAAYELDRNGGGTVTFLAGTFAMGDSHLELNDIDNVAFSGQGIDVTTLTNEMSSETDTEVFDIVGADRMTVRDMTISAGGPFRSTSDAIDFDNGQNSTVERVKVIRARGRGIVFDGKGTGWSANANTVRDCVVENVPGDGIEILASSGNVIEGCTVSAVGGNGIQLTKATSSAATPNKQSNENVVRNNVIQRSGLDGINVTSGDDNIFVGNRISNSSQRTTGRDGIRISSTDGVSCDRNEVESNALFDDQAKPTQTYGLHISSSLCNETRIGQFNTFSGNRLGKIRDSGTGTVYIADTMTPSTPSGVKATAVDYRVTVSWSASTDNVGVARYTVYRDGASVGSVGGSTTSFDDTSVAPSTTYSYTVTASDAAGNTSAQSVPALVTTPPPAPTLRVLAEADVYVDELNPGTNYGTSTQLRMDTSPRLHSYVRFKVARGGGGIGSATLRVRADSTHSAGFEVRRVADNTWNEGGVTFANAPAVGTLVASSGPTTAGQYVEIDVSSVVSQDGTYSFALTPLNSTSLRLSSRETSFGPELVVTG